MGTFGAHNPEQSSHCCGDRQRSQPFAVRPRSKKSHRGKPVKDSHGQRGKIIELLKAADGGWVSLPEIMDCADQYNARIFELRRLGFRIENRTKEIAGVRHSWFRLVTEPKRATLNVKP